MTLKHVSSKSVSELQKNSLPASFFFLDCGWNRVVVMQCHDGRETKGTIWENAIPIVHTTLCTHTNYLVLVNNAQNNPKCTKQGEKKLYSKCGLLNNLSDFFTK